MGIKCYRLALDLGRHHDELVESAQEIGLPIKSHLETLEAADAQALCEALGVEDEVIDRFADDRTAAELLAQSDDAPADDEAEVDPDVDDAGVAADEAEADGADEAGADADVDEGADVDDGADEGADVDEGDEAEAEVAPPEDAEADEAAADEAPDEAPADEAAEGDADAEVSDAAAAEVGDEAGEAAPGEGDEASEEPAAPGLDGPALAAAAAAGVKPGEKAPDLPKGKRKPIKKPKKPAKAAPKPAAEPAAQPAGAPTAEQAAPGAEGADGFIDRSEVRVVEANPAALLMSKGATTKKIKRLDENQQRMLEARLEKLREDSRGLGSSAAADQIKSKTGARGGRGGRTDRRDGRGGKKGGRKGGRQGYARALDRINQHRQTTAERTKAIEVKLPITLKDLSQAIGVPAGKIIQYIMQESGAMVTINAHVEEELIELICAEFDKQVEIKSTKAAEEHVDELVGELKEQREQNLQSRPPVVAVLGHVDHGKTSLLDKIRSTSVAAKEAGGITQNLSAWQVELEDGHEITFIDTPGHAAFTAMRARGAHSTDIVVLVVAADDGVMPQTEEAIDHAAAAETPIVVALNKVDRPNANPDKALQQLANLGLQAEEWGGATQVIRCSAITGDGIPELLEAIALNAEVMELSANPDMRAYGVVLEGKKDEGVGNVATLLIQGGTLNKGDAILAGLAHGKVRTMARGFGQLKQRVQVAGPSTPVEVTGLSEVPEAGDKFFVLESTSKAKQISGERSRIAHETSLASGNKVSITDVFGVTAALERKDVEQVQLLVKGDVRGSVEVLKAALDKLQTDEVKLKIIRAAIGGVNESDVLLADASEAMIVAFNVAPESRARQLADEKKVEIRSYSVIYELLDDVKKKMEGLLAPDLVEKHLGTVEVKKLFKSSRLGTIAGCQVSTGLVRRNSLIKLVRDGVILNPKLELDSLKRFKDDAREVKEGFECGLRLKGFNDLKEGDMLEAYEIDEVARTLD